MQYLTPYFSLFAALLSFSSLAAQSPPATVQVYPQTTKSICGISELERSKYFNLSDEGNYFRQQVANKGGATYFLDSLQISFGRSLGLVSSEVKWGKSLEEDPQRPGYVDQATMESRLQANVKPIDRSFRERFDSNLGAAYHDRHNAFPAWVKPYKTTRSGEEWIPKNLEAATEISLGILTHRFNDFNRPAYFELVNEPHWSQSSDGLGA